MPKTIESYKESSRIRAEFKLMFGCIPTSIMARENSDANDPIMDERGPLKCERHKSIMRKVKGNFSRKLFRISGTAVRGKKGGLSIFPQNIGKILVKFYTKEGQTVYDPFAGHNSRMQLVYNLKRNYIGVDVSKEFMKHNLIIRDKLLAQNQHCIFPNPCSITLIEGSSASVPSIDSECADFTITSPPYWDIEYYGDEPEQLGNHKNYGKFLDALQAHVSENYRILKPNTYCCWFVNDFVKNNTYFAYHSDLINLFQKAGFVIHAIYIVDLKRSCAFIRDVIKFKRFTKSHEYCMVFRKEAK